jgi:hypothetical protein
MCGGKGFIVTRDTIPVDLPPSPPPVFREKSARNERKVQHADRFLYGSPDGSVFTLSVRDTIVNEIEPDTLVFHDLRIPLGTVVEQPDGSLSINFEWTLKPAVEIPAARRTNENYVTVFTGEDGQPLPVVDVTKVLPETVPDDKADKLYEQYRHWLSVCTSQGILYDFFPIISPRAYEYSRGIIAVELMPGDPKDWPLSLLSLWSDYARFVELNLRDHVRAVML